MSPWQTNEKGLFHIDEDCSSHICRRITGEVQLNWTIETRCPSFHGKRPEGEEEGGFIFWYQNRPFSNDRFSEREAFQEENSDEERS